MATISSRLVFVTTSPRTLEKVIPEIALLSDNFSGQKWNADTQTRYMELLRDEDFFHGEGCNDPAFSARDRITRTPKALGFVRLRPRIELTEAGRALLSSHDRPDIFLRQLLKYQLPSPYHRLSDDAARFNVKPFLEVLRLVRVLGKLRFDELRAIGLQMTDWHEFPEIVDRIKAFRKAREESGATYKKFYAAFLRNELMRVFADRISQGKIKTREKREVSLESFLTTQMGNTRDYADALFRYLRATGLVQVSHRGKSMSVVPEREKEVDYILENIDRQPGRFEDEESYIAYLGDPLSVRLLTDDREYLSTRLETSFPEINVGGDMSVEQLRDTLNVQLGRRRERNIRELSEKIRNREFYDDIQSTFDLMRGDRLYDAPLIFEWNIWRAMTMIDGGDIRANLKFDDFGNPMSTAPGNMADIVCDYGDFMVCVEATLQGGQRQYESEGELVSRHLGKLKKQSGKPCYALFVAPSINDACVAHFFALHNMNISYYGGHSVIVPLPLELFRAMLHASGSVASSTSAEDIRRFFEYSEWLARRCGSEIEWYEGIKSMAAGWPDSLSYA